MLKSKFLEAMSSAEYGSTASNAPKTFDEDEIDAIMNHPRSSKSRCARKKLCQMIVNDSELWSELQKEMRRRNVHTNHSMAEMLNDSLLEVMLSKIEVREGKQCDTQENNVSNASQEKNTNVTNGDGAEDLASTIKSMLKFCSGQASSSPVDVRKMSVKPVEYRTQVSSPHQVKSLHLSHHDSNLMPMSYYFGLTHPPKNVPDGTEGSSVSPRKTHTNVSSSFMGHHQGHSSSLDAEFRNGNLRTILNETTKNIPAAVTEESNGIQEECEKGKVEELNIQRNVSVQGKKNKFQTELESKATQTHGETSTEFRKKFESPQSLSRKSKKKSPSVAHKHCPNSIEERYVTKKEDSVSKNENVMQGKENSASQYEIEQPLLKKTEGPKFTRPVQQKQSGLKQYSISSKIPSFRRRRNKSKPQSSELQKKASIIFKKFCK